MEKNLLDSIIALSKRRGFIYQGSEIYGGLAGTWDYGPLGVQLKRNIADAWWKHFVIDRDDMYGLDAAIIMNAETWKASGHVAGFSDPLVECAKCKRRFRADHISAGALKEKKCPDCGGHLGDVKQFNMMFKTTVGPVADETAVSYLRPETAQGIFVNFKNVVDSFHPKLPFGIAQIGKAFRNEIAPRDFLFRLRELEQMEIEYFVRPESWKEHFTALQAEVWNWVALLGLDPKKVHELEIPDGERAHYSKRTIDFEFDFPFGRKELYGLAYRTDFDLQNHAKQSKVDLSYVEDSGSKTIPHVIEPSFGLDRTVLAVLCDAYHEEEVEGEKNEKRIFLKLRPGIAPVKVAVFSLLKNKAILVETAQKIYKDLKKQFGFVEFDDNGNIGKRYRRQDEIGTPLCVTVDFDTIEKDQSVTVRHRDTMKQERVPIAQLGSFIEAVLQK